MNTNKQTWNQFIKGKGPYKYHLTITFTTQLSGDTAYKSMLFYLHLLNQKIFGSRYKKKSLHIEGFVFAESQIDGNTHYHILIKDNPLFHVADKPSFKHHVFDLLTKVKSGKSRQLMHPNGVQLDEVYSDDIIGYVTKTMPRYGQDTAGFIGALGIDGTDKISPVKYSSS